MTASTFSGACWTCTSSLKHIYLRSLPVFNFTHTHTHTPELPELLLCLGYEPLIGEVVRRHFRFVDGFSSAAQKPRHSMRSRLLPLVCEAFAWDVFIQTVVAETSVEEPTPRFLLGLRWFQVSPSSLCNLVRVDFSVSCKVGVQFHSSACGCPVFQTSFIEGTVLPTVYILGAFVEN